MRVSQNYNISLQLLAMEGVSKLSYSKKITKP